MWLAGGQMVAYILPRVAFNSQTFYQRNNSSVG
jgi:hypothetical protein